MISIVGVLKDYPEIGRIAVVWSKGKLYGNEAAISKIVAISKIKGIYNDKQFTNKIIKNWLDNEVTALMLIAEYMNDDYEVTIDQKVEFNDCREQVVC